MATKEPVIKKGDIRKCYGGLDYEVLEVSNSYDEVSEYDTTGACLECSTEELLAEIAGLDPADALFVAVRLAVDSERDEHFLTFVFLTSRDSEILGE